MFDIGFAELIIIAVVALLVIGPERLPDAVRTASAWLSRIRRSFNEIKQEVQQELHNDSVLRDLKESGAQLKRETEALRRDLSTDLSKDVDALQTAAEDISGEIRDAGSAATAANPRDDAGATDTITADGPGADKPRD